MSGELSHSYSIYIQATPEQVWEALTTPKFTTQYFPGHAAESDWQPGSDYVMRNPTDGSVMFEGKVVESDPPRRLVQTVSFKRNPAFEDHEEMTIAWDVEQFGEACRVTIGHRGSDSDAKLLERLTGHCPDMMSGLKTLLETGRPLHIGQRVAAEA